MWDENVNEMKCVRSVSVGKERVRVHGVRRTQYGKAVGGVRMPCVAKVEILSIPDGAHIVKKWVGRVGGDGGGVPRGRARAVYRFPEETSRPTTHIQDGETAMRGIMLPGPCLWGDLFVFSKNTAACLPVRVGGGKAEKVYRVGSSGFIMFAWRL